MSEPRAAVPAVHRAALFLGLWLVVAALAHPSWDQPPVWDTTMGLFPAAQVLAENGFDLGDLLARPSWEGGGPNLHPFSIVTWGTALVLRLVDGPAAFAWLHAIHYAIGAGLGVLLFRLARPALGAGGAGAVVGLLWLFPLARVQLGYLYTELPLAFATTGAVLAFVERRMRAAALWAGLACAIKETGVVVPVALGVAAALERAPAARRAGRMGAWLAIPAAVVALQVAVVLPSRVGESGSGRPYLDQIADVFQKLGMVPDWALALGLYAVVVALWAPRWLRALTAEAPAAADDRAFGTGALVVGAFLGFFATLPWVGPDEYLLPRYYVQVAPLVFFGLALVLRRVAPARVATGVAVAVAIFFVLNRDGRFLSLYPPVAGNEFSLAERSLEYRELLDVQREAIRAAQSLPETLPLYYGLPEHYLFQYPRSGYVEAPRPAGRCIWLDPVARRARLSEFPDRFAILVNFVGYGGQQFAALLRQAGRDPAWRVQSERFEQGRYRTALIRFTRSPSRAAPSAR